MTGDEQDRIIEELVRLVGIISQNVETLARELRERAEEELAGVSVVVPREFDA